MVKAQHAIANELINHLNNMDDKRRNSRHSAQSSHSAHSNAAFHSGQMNSLPDGADEPAVELRRARELLNSLSPEFPADRELERLSIAYHQTGSPPDSATSSVMFQPPSNGPPMHMMHDPFNDPRHMVYPVGQTAGIDPFHQDHIQNIPYSRPLSNPSGNTIAEPPSQITPPPKEPGGTLWGSKKPRVLLVEDDKTCARIGAKFLTNVDCTVEIAVSLIPVSDSHSPRMTSVTDKITARRVGSCEQGQPRTNEIRPHLHGHHHAHVRRRIGNSMYSAGRPRHPHHSHDLQHPAGRYRDLLPIRQVPPPPLPTQISSHPNKKLPQA
jgi:hypothetical protein